MNMKLNLLENSQDYLINALELYHIADEYGEYQKDIATIETELNDNEWEVVEKLINIISTDSVENILLTKENLTDNEYDNLYKFVNSNNPDYYEIGLAVADLFLDHVVLQALFIAPVCNELSVLHMCLHVLLAEGHSCELSEASVADITCILSLICFHVWKNAELNQLRVSKIIESEEVGSGFLKC